MVRCLHPPRLYPLWPRHYRRHHQCSDLYKMVVVAVPVLEVLVWHSRHTGCCNVVVVVDDDVISDVIADTGGGGGGGDDAISSAVASLNCKLCDFPSIPLLISMFRRPPSSSNDSCFMDAYPADRNTVTFPCRVANTRSPNMVCILLRLTRRYEWSRCSIQTFVNWWLLVELNRCFAFITAVSDILLTLFFLMVPPRTSECLLLLGLLPRLLLFLVVLPLLLIVVFFGSTVK